MTHTARERKGTHVYNTFYLTSGSIHVHIVKVGAVFKVTRWASLSVASKTAVNQLYCSERGKRFHRAEVSGRAGRLGQGNTVSTRAIRRNQVLVGNLPGGFRPLSADEAKIKWTFRACQASYASPEVAGNRGVFASAESALYCLNTRNSKLLWPVQWE